MSALFGTGFCDHHQTAIIVLTVGISIRLADIKVGTSPGLCSQRLTYCHTTKLEHCQTLR